MADLLAPPLGRLPSPGRHGAPGTTGIVLATRPFAAATLVAGRNRTALAGAMATAFGIELVDAPRRVAATGLACVGIGPGRWLALSEDAGLAARLDAAVGAAASVFDQSGGTVVLTLEGPELPKLLEKLLPLDLEPTVFPVDAAATTTVAHVAVTLWRDAAGSVCLAVGRSYLPALLRAILAAAAEYGLDWRG